VAPIVAVVVAVAPFIPAFSKDANFNSPAWADAVGFGLSPATLRYADCCAASDKGATEASSATNRMPAILFMKVLVKG